MCIRDSIVLVWLFKKHLLPALAVRENLIGLAAQIEMHHDVHSDLVAALQFNDSAASQYGSDELRGRVVEDTVKLSANIDYLFGFSRPELWKSLLRGVATVGIVIAVACYVPDYFNIFLKRLTLQQEAYPTKTVILSLETVEANAVVGRPVTFVVRVDNSKVVPQAGILTIHGKNDAESELALLPGSNPGEFTVTLPRVIDEFEVSVSTISFVSAGGWVVNGIAQPIVGRMSDQYGARVVMVWSVVVLGISTLGMALATGIWVLAFFYGIFGSFAVAGAQFTPVPP